VGVIRSRDLICNFTSPSLFLQQLTVEYSNFTELTRDNYKNIYIQEPVNSRVIEICVELTSVTNSRDRFGLYSLTRSMSVYMSIFTLTAI